MKCKVKLYYFDLNFGFCVIDISHDDVFELDFPEQARQLLFILVVPAKQ